MPKRAYPFDDNLLRQVKVYVGEKQVNNGVSSEERLQEVYAKTFSLLKAGVKALSQRLNDSAQMNPMELPLAQSTLPCKVKSTSKMKQMLLTNKLQLIHSDKIINDIQMDLCSCSKVIDSSIESRCCYCDKILCSSCLLKCGSCSELFCQNCCISIYDYKEQNMCLNCCR